MAAHVALHPPAPRLLRASRAGSLSQIRASRACRNHRAFADSDGPHQKNQLSVALLFRGDSESGPAFLGSDPPDAPLALDLGLRNRCQPRRTHRTEQLSPLLGAGRADFLAFSGARPAISLSSVRQGQSSPLLPYTTPSGWHST